MTWQFLGLCIFTELPDLVPIVWCTAIASGLWLYTTRPRRAFDTRNTTRWTLGTTYIFCLASLLLALAKWSSPDVRSDDSALAEYFFAGCVLIFASPVLFAFFDISLRDDVLERQNKAALWVVSGQLLGVTACYSGSNIGAGPGPEVVIFCSVLSIGGLVFLWCLLNGVSSASDHITIDRDEPSGIRVGAWFAASGIVLGSAIAGDWISTSRTVSDFARYAWPILPVTLCSALLEKHLQRKPKNSGVSSITAALVIGALYLFLAALYVYKRGVL